MGGGGRAVEGSEGVANLSVHLQDCARFQLSCHSGSVVQLLPRYCDPCVFTDWVLAFIFQLVSGNRDFHGLADDMLSMSALCYLYCWTGEAFI